MATKTGGFAEHAFDPFAFEVPLGLEDEGEIIEVAKKVVLDGVASRKKEYYHNVLEPFFLDSEVVCTALAST
jgi:hypothetical protein